MKIKLWIVDERNNEILEQLGTCITDSPNRACQMYEANLQKWEDEGAWAEVRWKEVKDKK